MIRTLQRKLYTKAKQEPAYATRSRTECVGATASIALAKHRMGKCACLGVKNIGKPCAGKPHVRFDEGGQARACFLLVRPAGRTYLEVKVLYTPGKGKC